MSFSDIYPILPLLILVAWACLLLVVDLFIPRDRKALTAILAAVGLAVSMAILIVQAFSLPQQSSQAMPLFHGMMTVDGFSIFLNGLVILCSLVGIALSYDYLKRMGLERGEYYVLLLFTTAGMMVMAEATDLIVVFLGLELLSIPLYILSGFARPHPESEEAALKYFLLGSFSTGFVVYGIALTFGATQTTSMAGIVAAIGAGTAHLPLLIVGAGLLLIGLGFKVAAVPFHMWTPDVYQGAPTTVVAFMAIGAKIGGFAALLRIFIAVFPQLTASLTPVLWGLAAITTIFGNLLAIAQSNIKRMLAYSSISHAGYILMALVPFGQPAVAKDAVAAALFYLVAYAVTNFTAWGVVIAMEKSEACGLEIDDYAGLVQKYPILGVSMAVAMLSFTGVPPTLGFVGKFFLFRTTLQGGFVGLALIGVFTSLISAYYYLRVVVVMFMRPGTPEARSESWLNLTVISTAIATVVLTAFLPPLFAMATNAIMNLF